ncbi:hypothetical protein [Streptomyces sp. GS7]|uniref:hypothetical protein n=1 Tax=Streptomyces sp. GS7 TaxID=2692234 RepID=UPI0013164C89|nr:hypothetical protein GR130_20860 [Streptomyces sp. GS7]
MQSVAQHQVGPPTDAGADGFRHERQTKTLLQNTAALRLPRPGATTDLLAQVRTLLAEGHRQVLFTVIPRAQLQSAPSAGSFIIDAQPVTTTPNSTAPKP